MDKKNIRIPVAIKEDSNDHPGLTIVEKKLPSGKISFEIYK